MNKYTSEDIIYLAGVPEDFKDKYVKMIIELIESKCKEQRDICYNEALILLGDHAEGYEDSVAKSIKNAPLPKI